MTKLDQMRKGTTTMVVLKLLADAGEPLHGYEIIRRLETSSEGFFQFKEGLIYPALHRMEQDGLLESVWQDEEGARPRKLYSLTERGRHQLEHELQRWQSFSQAVNQMLGLEEAPL
ncbi:MAG: PadR family transcriptional regulator [Anaerolineales bacterium]|nr:PadR family transcriptional regulator [Anaerolineales bacterium]